MNKVYIVYGGYYPDEWLHSVWNSQDAAIAKKKELIDSESYYDYNCWVDEEVVQEG